MSYLNEREILDYLMSSDFNEGLTQEEARFLLLKFRYHYRLLFAKTESQNHELSNQSIEITELKEKIEVLDKAVNDINWKYDQEIKRKLTWRERITGKKINE